LVKSASSVASSPQAPRQSQKGGPALLALRGALRHARPAMMVEALKMELEPEKNIKNGIFNGFNLIRFMNIYIYMYIYMFQQFET